MHLHNTRCRRNDEFIAFFIIDGFIERTHVWIRMIFIGQSHDRYHGASMFIVIKKVGPDIEAHMRSAYKAVGPIVAAIFTLLVFMDQR